MRYCRQRSHYLAGRDSLDLPVQMPRQTPQTADEPTQKETPLISIQEMEELVFDALIQDPETRDYRLGPIDELGSSMSAEDFNEACYRALLRYIAERQGE